MALARQVLSGSGRHKRRGANRIAKKQGFAAAQSELIIFEANLPKAIEEMTVHLKLGIERAVAALGSPRRISPKVRKNPICMPISTLGQNGQAYI